MKSSAIRIIILTYLLISLSILSCAPPHVRPPSFPTGPLTKENIIAIYTQQEKLVKSFISTGQISLKESDQVTRATILFAGKKDPFKIKIEISHLWGRPVAHLLLHNGSFELLSFTEKRYYTGKFDKLPSLTPIPDLPGVDQIWGLGRGFPKILDGIMSISPQRGDIVITDEGKTVQEIEFSNHDNLPKQVTYPDKGIRVAYSQFTYENSILYAKALLIVDKKIKAEIPLQFSQFVFNEDIPEEIFHIIKPKNFEYIDLRD